MKKSHLSSYSILIFITIIISISSFFIPSGQFKYKDPTSNHILSYIPSSEEIIKKQLTPVLSTYYPVEKTYLSLSDVFSAPIMGTIKIIPFVLLILSLGIFLETIKTLNFFQLLSYFFIKKGFSQKTTVLVSLAIVSVISTVTGLRDENVIFIGLLAPLFNIMGIKPFINAITILVGTVIGISSAILNPTIVGIFSSLSGFPITEGSMGRIIIYICFYILGAFIILKQIKKLETSENFKPNTKKKLEVTITKRNILANVIMIFVFFCFIYLLTIGYTIIEAQGYLIALSIIASVIGGIKEPDIIETIKRGTQELLPVGINIGIARGVLHIMEITNIKDTILFYASSLLSPNISVILFSFLLVMVIFLFFFLINSTSAVSSLTFPLIYPLTLPHNIPYSIFIIWFLIAASFSQITNPSGFILSYVRTKLNLDYFYWIKMAIPFFILLFFTWMISLFFI